MDYSKIIKEIERGKHYARDVDRQMAYALYRAMLAGDVPELELGALLIAMRIKAGSPRGAARLLPGNAGTGHNPTGARVAAAAHRHPQL